MHDAVLHPVDVVLSDAGVRARMMYVACDGAFDSQWHFRVAVDRNAAMEPGDGGVPERGEDALRLAYFVAQKPRRIEVDVYGVHLPYEVDAADWLDVFIESAELKVLSYVRRRWQSGVTADAVVSWIEDGAHRMGRLAAVKFGYRLMLVWAYCGAADYGAAAQDMAVTIETLRMVEEEPAGMVEAIRWAAQTSPVVWKMPIPESWQVDSRPGNQKATTFTAVLRLPEAPDKQVGMMNGAVLNAETFASEEDAFVGAADGIAAIGLDCTKATFVAEPESPPGFISSWLLRFDEHDGAIEVRARLMRHARCWVLLVVVSPGRRAFVAAWMQCGRALDVATLLMEITEPLEASDWSQIAALEEAGRLEVFEATVIELSRREGGAAEVMLAALYERRGIRLHQGGNIDQARKAWDRGAEWMEKYAELASPEEADARELEVSRYRQRTARRLGNTGQD